MDSVALLGALSLISAAILYLIRVLVTGRYTL